MLVVFMCNHCPYVKHIREALVELVKEYQAKGVAVVGINSNDVETYPDDCPEDLRNALDALLAGSEVVSEQKPSMGCNIKWKQGNEPEYFKI
jgi:thiol-disulfide isomerase/thioredoxin